MAGVKRVQAIAAAVFLATVGATGLVAVPPAAASVTVAAQASHPAIPAIQCHIVPHRFVTYASRCRSPHGYLCIPNNTRNLNTSPVYVSNGCIYRVWLYLKRNKGGAYPLCVSPRTATSGLARRYQSFWVSQNTNPC
jgi:hypothetical protein